MSIFDKILRSPEEMLRMQQAAQMVEMQARMNDAQMAHNERERATAPMRADVIDLVPVADGIYAVPAALEHRARSVG